MLVFVHFGFLLFSFFVSFCYTGSGGGSIPFTPFCFNNPIIGVNSTFVKPYFALLKHFVDIAHFQCYTNRIKGVNTLNERIKKVRKSLDLTQQEFADRLSIKRNTVATYERGKSEPSDAAVILICKTFHVSETWLRTGEGEMFIEAPSDTLDALAREYHLDRFGRAVVEKMLNLNEKQWAAFHDFAVDVLKSLPEDAADPAVDAKNATTTPPLDTTGQERTAMDAVEQATPDIMAELAELKRQNQEMAAEIAAMKEEDALYGLMDGFSTSPLASAGKVKTVERAKK